MVVYEIIIESLHISVGLYSGVRLVILGIEKHKLTRSESIEQLLHSFLGANSLIHLYHLLGV